MSRMTSKVWYWVALGLVVPGVAVAVLGLSQTVKAVEGMQRVVMPGKAEIWLSGGRTTMYAESRSIVDGKAYHAAEGLGFRCAVTDHAGKQVPLERSSSSVSYSIGGFEGTSAFDVQIDGDPPGPYIDLESEMYVLACDAPGPFVIAIGGGVGTGIVVGLAGVVPIFVGAIMFLIVLIKRIRQKRRAARAIPRATVVGGA